MNRTAMPIRLTSSLMLSLALITSACGSPMKTPDIKRNLHPKMRYEITMTIDGAPGPFDSVTGFVQYKVMNDRSVPMQPISGATLAPENRIPVAFTRVNDHKYLAVVYTDLMQDEDYFGMGVCHWSMVATTANLKVKTVTLSAAVWLDDVVSQKAATEYFVKDDYSSMDGTRFVLGDSDPHHQLQDFRTDIFSVTFTAKEDFQ